MDGKRVISGTWGEVWLDSEKVTGFDGTGSLRMHKVNSRMAKKILKDITQGKDVRFTIITKLADPDSYGTERAVLKGVSFDDLTIADWEAKQPGKIEAPFTFSKVEYLDMI